MSANAAAVELVPTEEEERTVNRCLEAPKYTCNLGGALSVITNVHRFIPIIHAGAGCGMNQLLSFRTGGGRQGIGYMSGTNAPSTNLGEIEVVFGGENRLAEQIRATLDLIDGDAYVVVNGCISAMIGDDVAGVVQQFAEARAPVLAIEASGFGGNTYVGYDAAFSAFVKHIAKPQPKIQGLVNILGLVPYQDVFWRGTLRSLRSILEKLGLKVNQVIGDHSGILGVHALSAAELTIVLSPWVGVPTARLIESRFGIPYIAFPNVPVGPVDTSDFLRSVAEKLGLDSDKVEAVIAEEEREAYDDLNIAGDTLSTFGSALPFSIVGNSAQAVGLVRFLANVAGFSALEVIINDDPPEEVRPQLLERLNNLESGLQPSIHFEVDTWKIRQILKKSICRVLLASSQERYLAESERKIFVATTFPANNRLVVRDHYAGYGGGINIVEQIVSLFVMP
jgi:nitrogenase molybdenum-iron protein beta chain